MKLSKKALNAMPLGAIALVQTSCGDIVIRNGEAIIKDACDEAKEKVDNLYDALGILLRRVSGNEFEILIVQNLGIKRVWL